jgi:hypothetical protein
MRISKRWQWGILAGVIAVMATMFTIAAFERRAMDRETQQALQVATQWASATITWTDACRWMKQNGYILVYHRPTRMERNGEEFMGVQGQRGLGQDNWVERDAWLQVVFLFDHDGTFDHVIADPGPFDRVAMLQHPREP